MSDAHLGRHAMSGRARALILSLAALALMLTTTLAVYRLFNVVRTDEIRAETEARAGAIASKIRSRINLQLGAIWHVADDVARGYVVRGDLGASLARLQEQFEDFQAINWVSPAGKIEIVTPIEGNAAALGLSIPDLPLPYEALSRARETGQIAASPPIELAQGGKGFVVYLPVMGDGGILGFVNGVFRSDSLLNDTIRTDIGRTFVADIRDGAGDTVFRSGGEPADFRAETSLEIADRTWILSLSPTVEALASSRSAEGRVILLLGTALALTIGYLSYAALIRQQALKESEERFAYAMEGASEGLWDWNLETDEIYFSPRYFQILGYRPDELEHRFETFAGLVHPDDRAHALMDPEDQFGSVATVAENEFRLRHKDGSWRNILSRAFISRRDGRTVRMIGTHLDITESHRQQRRLHEAERLMREGIEALPVGFAYFDEAGRLVLWNHCFPELLPPECAVVEAGLHFEDLIRRLAPELSDASGYADPEAFVRERLDAIGGAGSSWHGVLADGRHVTAYERPTSGGGFITVLQEVSERVEAEKALRRSQARLEEAARIARLGSWTVHPDGKIELSPEACEILCLPQEGFDGQIAQIEHLVHPDDRQRVRDAFLKAWKEYTPYDCVHRAITSAGDIRTLRERGEILRDDGGAFLGMNGSVQDITEQARLESQLHQAQKMEAIGQLTGGLAHDFNNLLAVILGNAELLQEDFPEAEPLAATIIRASRRGAELAQRLLTFARRQPLWPEPVDIAGLVRDIYALSERTLGDTIEVLLHLPEEPWFAATDPGQAENALLNLALNARDAMPEGGRLTISSDNLSLGPRAAESLGLAPGDYVRISVRDEGTGMSEAVRERVFEPFFTTKAHGKGSGLGLSMVYGFARQSGGAVEIDSAEGVGTCVRLFLPRAAPQQESATADRTPDAAASPLETSGATILVIEDEPDVRRMAMHLLSGAGYRVLEAEDADSALAMAADHPEIALVLSDVMLPGRMLGPALAEEIRKLRPGLRIVFMSGFVDARSSPDDQLPPDAQFLRKPFRKADLTTAIAKALNRRRQDAPAMSAGE